MAIVDNAAMNVSVYKKKIPWRPCSQFFGRISRNGMTESHGCFIQKFLQNCHTGFHGSCTILHSHKQFTVVPISLHPHQPWTISVFVKEPS